MSLSTGSFLDLGAYVLVLDAHFLLTFTLISSDAFYRLITIFDCKVVMKWEGTASDGTEVKGTLTIPEVSHEIICDQLSEFLVSTSSRPHHCLHAPVLLSILSDVLFRLVQLDSYHGCIARS